MINNNHRNMQNTKGGRENGNYAEKKCFLARLSSGLRDNRYESVKKLIAQVYLCNECIIWPK